MTVPPMTTADVDELRTHPTEVVTAHGAEQLGVHHLRDGIVGGTASPVNPIAVL